MKMVESVSGRTSASVPSDFQVLFASLPMKDIQIAHILSML